MELTVSERLSLQGILPQENDFSTLKLVRKIKDQIGFDAEEYQAIGFMQEHKCPKCGNTLALPVPVECGQCSEMMRPTGRVTWRTDAPAKNFEFGEVATELIKKQLKFLSDNAKLRDECFTLYQKFIGGD